MHVIYPGLPCRFTPTSSCDWSNLEYVHVSAHSALVLAIRVLLRNECFTGVRLLFLGKTDKRPMQLFLVGPCLTPPEMDRVLTQDNQCTVKSH